MCLTDCRDGQSAVYVQAMVVIAMAGGDIKCLEQTKQPMNIETVCQEEMTPQ